LSTNSERRRGVSIIAETRGATRGGPGAVNQSLSRYCHSQKTKHGRLLTMNYSFLCATSMSLCKALRSTGQRDLLVYNASSSSVHYSPLLDSPISRHLTRSSATRIPLRQPQIVTVPGLRASYTRFTEPRFPKNRNASSSSAY
jgi:hypothetical protein